MDERGNIAAFIHTLDRCRMHMPDPNLPPNPPPNPPGTRCLYCGGIYPLGADRCPQCQAPTHHRPRARLRQFRWFVALLALLCLILILWLPR